MRPHLVRILVLVGATAIVAALLGGCSSGGGPTVADPWVRLPAAADQTAAYMTITNPGSSPDALLSASSPAAKSVELHQSTTDASGMTSMTPVERLEIPAGGTVELKPGGYHLMMMGLTSQLAVGSKVDLELVFEKAGKVTVTAEVKQG
jgi:copper(I)-binding protein